jgi:hypothetical protein
MSELAIGPLEEKRSFEMKRSERLECGPPHKPNQHFPPAQVDLPNFVRSCEQDHSAASAVFENIESTVSRGASYGLFPNS